MANEFKHKTVGTTLTQAEWEATDGTGHQLDSQATGDIIYASSSTVLSRLGVGTDGDLLNLGSGIPAWTSAISTAKSFADNILLGLGTGADGVLLNRSTTLAANTALTGVMIGTPVTPAVAANSLLVSNVTASGDYLLALNNGGNSQAWHWVDSSAGTQTLYAAGVARILLNSTGGSFTGTWSNLGTVTTVDINGGSIDGAAIGAASHSTIKGTTVDATTDFTIGSTVITDDKVAYGAAGVFQMVAATEDALKFTDGTNDLMRFNTKVDTDRMNFLDVGTPGAAVSFAAASNSSFRLFRLLNYTVTLTGDAANPAAMEGLMLYSGIPTLTDSTAVTVTKASSIYVQAPVEAGSVTLTGAMALHIADAGGTPTNQYGIYIDALTAGATADYAIYSNAGVVRFGDSVSIDGDIDFEGAQEIATSSGALTLSPTTDVLIANGTGLVVGHTAQIAAGGNAYEAQILGTTDADSGLLIVRSLADAHGGSLNIGLSRHGTIGTVSNAVTTNDALAKINWFGSDTSALSGVAGIYAYAGSTWSGSNRETYMKFFTAANGATSSTSRLQITSAGVVSIGGDIDLNGTGDLLNVGAAGNDWTTDALIQNGGTNAQSITVLTNGTTGTSSTLRVAIAASSGGSCMVNFKQGSGNGDANNMSYTLAYHGTGGYMHLQSADFNGSSGEADIFRISDGQASIDANTTWDDNAFDDYDDVALLEAAIRPTADAYDFGKGVLKRGRDALIEVGILRRYDDGFVGYNDQRMAALLAGAIYQNRERAANLEERLAALEAKGG